MRLNKNIRSLAFVICLFMATAVNSQNVSVYKIDNLLKRINNTSDTTYIVNFWATWCKPCVAELPEFEKFNQTYKSKKVKVLLVSLDFVEEKDKKLKTFLDKNNYSSEVILLDEVNGNDFINKISTSWSGAIPATIAKKHNKTIYFNEEKLTFEELEKIVTEN